ncbi:MAG TPA: hypothetical protein VLE23_15375, partial [Geminicoccaceae bacterium]|nr:hypothetical protein [Geminicoccaceae bacterium]
MSIQGASRLLHKAWRRMSNLARFGVGASGRERKKSAKAKRRDSRFFENERWQRDADQAKRSYSSYGEYVTHQASKLPGVVH